METRIRESPEIGANKDNDRDHEGMLSNAADEPWVAGPVKTEKGGNVVNKNEDEASYDEIVKEEDSDEGEESTEDEGDSGEDEVQGTAALPVSLPLT
ncbi:hypothetical protein U1Q18_003413 [Sarracenia purpurea var. burkii]